MEASSSKPRPSASIPSCTELELRLANSHERDLRGLEHRWSMNERDWKQPDDKSNPSVPAASSKPAVNQARDVSTGTTVRINYKHSLAIRWMHWINFPLLFVMIYSGLLIYWADSQHEGLNAHCVYRVGFGAWTLFRLFPPWFYNTLHLKFQLAKGLGYHFFFMWFFALNGMAYVLYTFLSGEWRELLPTRHSFAEAIDVILHDLGLSKRHPPQRKYRSACLYVVIICTYTRKKKSLARATEFPNYIGERYSSKTILEALLRFL